MADLGCGNRANGSANMDVYTNRLLRRQLGEIPELITASLFLVSDNLPCITGQTLRVDGAWASDHYL